MPDDVLTLNGQRVYGDSADPDGPWSGGKVRCDYCLWIWTAIWPFSVFTPPFECPHCENGIGVLYESLT